MTNALRVRPTGECWCDCGGHPKPGSFFLPGHDKRAERYLAAISKGESIAERLHGQQYVPGLKSLREAVLKADPSYEECGRPRLDGMPCRVIGRGQGMRVHRASDDQHAND